MKPKTSPASDELNRTRYPVVKNVCYCIKSTAEFYPLLLVWCVLTILISVVLPVMTTYLPKIVIEKLTLKSTFSELMIVVLIFTGAIAILTAAKKFFTWYIFAQKMAMCTYYLSHVASKGLTTDYQNQENGIFRKLQTEAFSCCNGTQAPLAMIYFNLIELFTSVLGLAVFWTILSQLHWMVVVFLTATTVASYILNRRITRWMDKNSQKRISCQQRFNYISSSSGELRSAKDIRLYHMVQWFSDIYKENMGSLERWYKRLTNKLFGVSICDSGLALLREAAAYLYLLYLVWGSRITAADFVLYFGVIAGFSSWLSGIFSKLSELNQWNLKINYYRSYIEYPESCRRENGVKIPPAHTPKEIELKNVSYKYEGSEEYALYQINLKITPGEHLAVVGLNGAGKSTLVKLLCGLIDPTEGQVLYDGVDIREYNRPEFYDLFSAVFQQFSILPVTIGEIVAETPSEKLETARVESCLKAAGLWDKIERLPQGLKSQFGKTIYDDGIEFSGGEVQKLLLARALYKSAPVLLLDEPTAALDPIAESNMYQNYSQISKGRTAVFISHRLASTSFCDRVILIENGAVCEEGTHNSLIALKGKYYDLFEIQAKYYREKVQRGEAAE